MPPSQLETSKAKVWWRRDHSFGGKVPGHAYRRRKVTRDSIKGITRPAIRRLARRGGIKRLSFDVYDEVRTVLKQRLQNILLRCVTYVEHRKQRTITVDDVIFALKLDGRPIWGY